MNVFKPSFHRHHILWAIRWYCKFGISYSELQEMLAERGINVEHTTIYCWVQHYAPQIDSKLWWYWYNSTKACGTWMKVT